MTKIGGDFYEDYNKKLSLINFINGKVPPFFMYGDSDFCISPSKILLLHKELRKNNVKSIRHLLTGDSDDDDGFDTECAINYMVNCLNQKFFRYDKIKLLIKNVNINIYNLLLINLYSY